MKPVVSISCLGHFGRFGNQLFQYAVARKFADMHGARLETPRWIGQRLFFIDDPPISGRLPRMPIDHLPHGHVNVDLFGYFQFQAAIDILSVHELRQWYSFRPEWKARFTRPRPYYIAANLRRGDYLSMTGSYAIVHEQSYIKACGKFGLDESSLVFIGEEHRRPDPFLDKQGLGFLSDFFSVMYADIILRANSTFSWWAALLSRSRVFSPLVEGRTGDQTVDFVEGNWPRMCTSKDPSVKITDLHVSG